MSVKTVRDSRWKFPVSFRNSFLIARLILSALLFLFFVKGLNISHVKEMAIYV